MDLKTNAGVQPRIIIHGGAGNITRANTPAASYAAYRSALQHILASTHARLQLPGATALDIAVDAVSQLENNPLFNAGHGAVFTTAGTHELEASVMVSRGRRKRGVGVMGVRAARHPIRLAREMLLRGDEEGGGGAGPHSQLHGPICDDLARRWGLELVRPSFFWTRLRWDQHRRGLGLGFSDDEYRRAKREADEQAGFSPVDDERDEDTAVIVDETAWRAPAPVLNTTDEYVPKGTVGCVVLDASGTLCVATSTGGLTNKLPGRIGDTPTLGAGFWAEEWVATRSETLAGGNGGGFAAAVADCFPNLAVHLPLGRPLVQREVKRVRAAALSGTGNGDSFLRIGAARTVAAMARFAAGGAEVSLRQAVAAVAGPEGALQQSAEDRWGNGEGEGGIIGIELDGGVGRIVADYNCGGMFHAWVDDEGKHRFAVFQDEKVV